MNRVLYVFAVMALCALSQSTLGNFTVGPYLLNVTTDSAVVAFQLDKKLSAKVRVLKGDEWVEFASTKEDTQHFIKVTGLEPDFTYDYQVVCDDSENAPAGQDEGYQIRTAAPKGNSFSFAVYGDARPGENKTARYHQEIIDTIISEEPLFCLSLGDMVDDGSDRGLWQEFFRIESKLLRRTAIYPVLGDNDFAQGRGLYSEYFPNLQTGYYAFEWGGVKFYGLRALNTRNGDDELGTGSAQYQWLENQLSQPDAQGAPFRVVFLHDPVLISRGRSSDVLRRVWAPLFEKYKVDVVFASWHMYERSMNAGVTYIISGGAGAELIWMDKDSSYQSQAEARRHHFCKVDVTDSTMTISAITNDRTVLDSITLFPRSQKTENADHIERLARRLAKEIVVGTKEDCPQLPMTFFSTDCLYCKKLLNHDLPRWADENNISLKISYFDLNKIGVYDLLLSAGLDFGRQNIDVPAFFLGKEAIGGEAEINKNLATQFKLFSQNPRLYLEQSIVPFAKVHDTHAVKEVTFDSLTCGIVLTAGLLDGINPCAFTTVVLLISYLSLVGGGRRQMIYTGGVFTFAVFITYLIIGAAFFGIIRILLSGHLFSVIVNSLLLIAVAGLAVFSLVDFVRCVQGRAKDMTLQLPSYIKETIRGKIRAFARNKTAIIITSFGLGVVITGMELACTGQVYFPIVTMISEPKHRMAASIYLLTYNIAFIVPLVIVFLLAVFGVNSKRIAEFFSRRIAFVKLAMMLLFISLGILMIANMRWLL